MKRTLSVRSTRANEPKVAGPPARGTAPVSDALHVAPLDVLAEAAVSTAMAAEEAVFGSGRRADRAIALALRHRRDLAAPDHRFVAQAVFALFRWHGWIEGLRLDRLDLDGLRASIVFSYGSHDEWNIARILNERRRGATAYGLANQISVFYDGRPVVPAAYEQPVATGDVGRCIN